MASDTTPQPTTTTTTTTKTVTVTTTLPRLPAPAALPEIRTPRLLLRGLRGSDLAAFHALRRDAAFMAESTLGRPDADLAESRAALECIVAGDRGPHFWYGVFERADDGTADGGALLGDCGVHTVRGSGAGWPEVGYKLDPARWGRGYATEAMGALLEAWWALPRGREEGVAVYAGTLGEGMEAPEGEGKGGKKEEEEVVVVREHVVAEVAAYNEASCRVLQKLGFRDFGAWEEPDTQLHRLGEPLMLRHFVLPRPADPSS